MSLPTPYDGRSDPRSRDESGLLSIQHRYFGLLAGVGSRRDACLALGIPNSRVTRWLREDPAFLHAHEDYFKDSKEATKARFQELQERLPDLAIELMESYKKVSVKSNCAKCGHTNTVVIDTTNDTVRARIWADMMKATGHLTDVRRIEGEVSVTHLTAGQRIAIEKLRRGSVISVQQRKELEAMGMLEGLTTYDGSNILAGESNTPEYQ